MTLPTAMMSNNKPNLGPYTPTLILHGGAGSITRSHLPPELYAQYASSLISYATSTHALLQNASSAIDAACHAVSLMEDDPLFNCGRGSVFTSGGEIEMEASLMVSSVDPNWEGPGSVKRGAAVSLVRETRHPISLAKEILLQGDGEGWKGLQAMHCQRSGKEVEEWGWKIRGLERKGKDWFWTKRRWEEHLRDLEKHSLGKLNSAIEPNRLCNLEVEDESLHSTPLPIQGTVGAVCMDSWGTLAVATSTGGLTNKAPGRIGDTPTLGAGFWAESWEEEEQQLKLQLSPASLTVKEAKPGPLDLAAEDLSNLLTSCIPGVSSYSTLNSTTDTAPLILTSSNIPSSALSEKPSTLRPYVSPPLLIPSLLPSHLAQPEPFLHSSRRAVALSGTGNGDSFLRTSACRTAAAQCRFGKESFAQVITKVAGPGGELQRSAGKRWGKTGEGEGGVIGIEIMNLTRCSDSGEEGIVEEKESRATNRKKWKTNVVADFNCGGMWRAWIDEETGLARVRVFRGEYE